MGFALKIFGIVLIAGLLLIASYVIGPVFAQERNWEGFYVGGQFGLGLGEHALSYENPEYGLHANIYSISLRGDAQAIGLGYRHQLGDSRFYLGARAMVHFGELSGSREWSALEGNLNARVDFASKTVYTVGGELGYAFRPRLYGYLGLGLAGAELSWRGTGTAFGHTLTQTEGGWSIGHYAAVGGSYDLGNKWAIGGELQHFRFKGSENMSAFGHSLGSFKAILQDTRIALSIAMRF